MRQARQAWRSLTNRSAAVAIVLTVITCASCGEQQPTSVETFKTAAEQAKTAEGAEKRRSEEEARRRAEEEARRRAEEELRRHPPTYSVRKGDHLWAISGMEQIYSKAHMWPLIFDANRDKIRDPDLIYPEQELTIPRQMSDEQVHERLFELWHELRQFKAKHRSIDD
jgi:nucleoid-associated protein YgaU